MSLKELSNAKSMKRIAKLLSKGYEIKREQLPNGDFVISKRKPKNELYEEIEKFFINCCPENKGPFYLMSHRKNENGHYSFGTVFMDDWRDILNYLDKYPDRNIVRYGQVLDNSDITVQDNSESFAMKALFDKK